MESAEKYIERMHGELINHFDISPVGLCVPFAFGVERRMSAVPVSFARFEDKSFDTVFRTRVINPLLYGGGVKMGGHVVCFRDDVAYDPLVGSPVPLMDFSKLVFGEVVPFYVVPDRDVRAVKSVWPDNKMFDKMRNIPFDLR